MDKQDLIKDFNILQIYHSVNLLDVFIKLRNAEWYSKELENNIKFLKEFIIEKFKEEKEMLEAFEVRGLLTEEMKQRIEDLEVIVWGN